MHRFRSVSLLSLLICAGVTFAAPPQTATLAVENMTCGTCPIVVKKALERVPGVTSTSVDFGKKTATEAGFPSKVISKP